MVSAYLADALRDPTGELKELYASYTSDNFPAEVTKHFSRVFEKDEGFKQIPPLSTRSPPEAHVDRALVRFRGMVQDPSASAEMYLSRSKGGKLCGWGIEGDDTDHDNVEFEHLRECTVVWAVSVPGESSWVSEELDAGSDSEASSMSHTPLRPHKSPNKNLDHLGVQIKLYDGATAEGLKSTDIATFVGILTNEALTSDLDEPLVVPTLHVLFISPDSYSGVTRSYPCRLERTPSTMDVRQQLIQWIAEEALGGDAEAAEWVLMMSLSRIQSRNPPLLQPSLTLSHFPLPTTSPSSGSTPSTSVSTLSVILPLLLPLTRTLPLSINLLNTASFEPESIDEDLNAGTLQLPKGFLLLVTEHGVQEGKLLQRGIMNIRALQEVMSSQNLSYSFPFSRFSFPTDISCIVTTDGSKSAFFKTDITVDLHISTPSEDVSNLYKPRERLRMPSQEQLTAFRDLIAGARSGKVSVTETTSAYIQQDFVRDRQADKSITSEDLIRRMTVAKLYALSCHATELTIDMWERSKALDDRRKARLL